MERDVRRVARIRRPGGAPLIEAPALLVWGDADTLVSREMQHQLARSIPDASLRVYSGVGHTPRWEDPARFSTELVAFA